MFGVWPTAGITRSAVSVSPFCKLIVVGPSWAWKPFSGSMTRELVMSLYEFQSVFDCCHICVGVKGKSMQVIIFINLRRLT